MKPYLTASLMAAMSVVMLSGCFDSGDNAASASGADASVADIQGHSSNKNKTVTRDSRQTLLQVAGLSQIQQPVAQVFSAYVQEGVWNFNQQTMSLDAKAIAAYKTQVNNHTLPMDSLDSKRDLAGIAHRPQQALIYFIRNKAGEVTQVVLPVFGMGYFDNLYGYLALDAHSLVITGIGFYQQAETPALGGRIMTDKNWQQQFIGKRIFANKQVKFRIVTDGSGKSSQYRVDGISGATHTSHGVENLIRFWCGPDGFEPLLSGPSLQQALRSVSH